MRRMGAIILGLSLALAGCIGAAGDSSSGMNLEGEAGERANEWNESADLVNVASAESRHAKQSPMGAWFSGTEGELGDGQAPAWNYTYEAGDRALTLTVDADGTVLHEEEHGAGNETAITDWRIDSTEAADRLEEHNETWAQASPSMALYVLDQETEQEDPRWFIMLAEEDRSPLVGTVNATTGEVIDVDTFEFEFDFSMGPIYGGDETDAESGSFDGELTGVEPDQAHTFEIEESEHAELYVALSLDEPEASTVTASLEGPQGGLGDLTADQDQPEAQDAWEDPPAGEYVIDVTLEEGAYQEYTIHWCATSGQPFGPQGTC